MTVEYLSLADVAARIGVGRDTVKNYNLPDPDARIGSALNSPRGWLPATIDEWNASRPGPGNWGPRPRGTEE